MGRKKDPTNKLFILKTAFSLFLQNGYKEVTIQKIMDATDLSKGAIYHHFKNKEEIYQAALQEYYFKTLNNDVQQFITGNFRKDIQTIYSFAAEVLSKIENLTEQHVDFPIRNFFSFQLESETYHEIRERVVQAVKENRRVIRALVEDAVLTKQIRNDLDTEAITFQIIGMVEGIIIHHSTEKNNVKNLLLEKYKKVFDAFFKMVCT